MKYVLVSYDPDCGLVNEGTFDTWQEAFDLIEYQLYEYYGVQLDMNEHQFNNVLKYEEDGVFIRICKYSCQYSDCNRSADWLIIAVE